MTKKILITGACGFIGSHLTEFFLGKGFKVLAYDLYNSKGSYGWLREQKDNNNLKVVLGDIRDFKSTLKIVEKVDYVFHLAALISIPYSYSAPYSFFQTNVEGTYNLLEACSKLKKKIIITSTSEVYGSGKIFPMNEDHPLNAQSPYAASKISADQLSLSFNKTFDTKVNIIRPFNTYGPRQSSRAIIPNIIKQALVGTKIDLGNINSQRDLMYVSDLCEAYYSIFKNAKKFGHIYNVGTGRTHTIAKIVQNIGKILNKKLIINIQSKRKRPQKSEVNKLLCDAKKIKKDFKWKPKKKIINGLSTTINWLKENIDEYNIKSYDV